MSKNPGFYLHFLWKGVRIWPEIEERKTKESCHLQGTHGSPPDSNLNNHHPEEGGRSDQDTAQGSGRVTDCVRPWVIYNRLTYLFLSTSRGNKIYNFNSSKGHNETHIPSSPTRPEIVTVPHRNLSTKREDGVERMDILTWVTRDSEMWSRQYFILNLNT